MHVQTPEPPRRFSLRLDVYSPPQVLQITGRIYQLVLASLWSETLQAAGPLCSTVITPLPCCRVGGDGAFALPPSARSNGSCSFPASRFPVWTPRRRQEHPELARSRAEDEQSECQRVI
jgi:hypothetical protein